MRPKVKNARLQASKLHGASAQYVSLVDRGANETPFAVIKSANGAKAMPIAKRKKAAKSHKTVASGRKNQVDKEFTEETLVAKMVFSADVFEDEADVNSWLDDAEWEVDSVQITKNADGDFEARPNELTDDDWDRMSPVEIEEEGVSGFVGSRKVFLDDLVDDVADEDEEVDEDEADDETVAEAKSEDEASDDEDEADEEAVEADAEVTSEEKGKKKPKYSKRAEFLKKRQEKRTKEKKFDAWDVMFSDSNTLTKAITAGMSYDTTPPGYNEVQFAFNTVVANILGGEDDVKQDSLNKVAADYAEIIGGLDNFFDKYVEADEEEIDKFVKSDEEAKESLVKWAEAHADFLANDADGTAPAKTEKKAKVAKATDEATTIDYSKVADLVAKAVAPLSEEVASVTGKVEKLATRRPTKKAAGPDDSGNAAPSTAQADHETDDRWAAKKQSKALLG